MKALLQVKAAPLDSDEEAAWFDGRIPRKILTIPFGGPIPAKGAPLGTDLDGQWFDDRTDIYGPHRFLRQDRERLVDWHHSAKPPGPGYGDPTGMMSGHFLGKSILDPDPDEDGWWSEVWMQHGEKRVALIKRLAARGAALFGSSQPVPPTKTERSGRISLWPHMFQTLSTSPQNTYSVLRPKAVLDDLDSAGITLADPIRDLLAGLDDLDLTSLRGEGAAKAGRVLSARNEAALRKALDELSAVLAQLQKDEPDAVKRVLTT